MTTNRKMIIEQALQVRTLEEATEVQELIASATGARHQRPLGDTWNNQGILTGSGTSYDHKARRSGNQHARCRPGTGGHPQVRFQDGHSLQETLTMPQHPFSLVSTGLRSRGWQR